VLNRQKGILIVLLWFNTVQLVSVLFIDLLLSLIVHTVVFQRHLLMSISAKIRPVALAVIELACLKGITNSVSQSVGQSVRQ